MRRFESVEDAGDLVDLPIVSVLATYRADGSVLLSPVWHEWRDGGFNVCIGDDVKARHVRRDPRVSLVVAESRLPYRGVEVRGWGSLSPDAYRSVAHRIASRYLGPPSRRYVDETPNGLVLRIEPEYVRVWNLADEFAKLA